MGGLRVMATPWSVAPYGFGGTMGPGVERTAVNVGGSGMGRRVVDDLSGSGARVVGTSRNPRASSGTAELESNGAPVVEADFALFKKRGTRS